MTLPRSAAPLALLLSLPSALVGLTSDRAPAEYVDPNIGSAHSRWFFYTPGAMPFGMAKPGPTTDAHYGNKSGWEAVGYDGRHTSIEGFANFHEFQVGGVVLMPTVGPLKTIPGELGEPDQGYRSRFDKADEHARPGYYSVLLADYGIRAELTATKRVAFHRYTFPASAESRVLFDIGHRQGESGAVVDASVRRSALREVEGFVITHPEYTKNYQPGSYVKMYFVARVSRQPQRCGSFRDTDIFPDQSAIQGPDTGLYLTFTTREREAIEVKIGLSYTSLANARLNLENEAESLSFEDARRQAERAWDEMLGRILVTGGREADKVKLYTGLYHALLGRGLASDINGEYPRNDGGIGKIPPQEDGTPQYHHYNTDAVWGAFWDLTQLWALAYPDYYSEFVRCQLDLYSDCGWLPDGIAAGKFVSGVGTDFMGLVVSSAFTRGIRDFDAEKAFQAVVKNEIGWQNRPRGVGKADVKSFLDRGYVPQLRNRNAYSGSSAEGSQFSASHTLEYSFSAYAAAQFAKALGKTDEQTRFMRLSEGWKLLFDPDTGFIRPKDASGAFMREFDPKQVWVGFQEANAWQYTFYVPHDPAGLISKLGVDTFNDRLEQVFQAAERAKFGGGETVNAFAGIENFYNHGNQPSLHIAWLFNYSGRPWLTQYWVRRICDVFYGTDALHGYGYGQDEDQGQLGAWFVLAAIGLFDVQGGTSLASTLQLATPLFERVTIQLSPKYHPGESLEIRVRGNPTDHVYIRSARHNGRPLDRCWLPWESVVRGGTIELTVGDTPNRHWGTHVPPPSASTETD